MTRKLPSAIFLLTAISIGLGAFGHGSQWSLHVMPALNGLDPDVVRLLELVWYWVSGAMLTLGAVLTWAWRRMGQGDTNVDFIPWMSGAFYLVEGVYGAVYLGKFFLLFVVQAVLLWASVSALRRSR